MEAVISSSLRLGGAVARVLDREGSNEFINLLSIKIIELETSFKVCYKIFKLKWLNFSRFQNEGFESFSKHIM